MKKLFGTIFLIFFIISALVFVVLLNLRLTVLSESRLKDVVRGSGFSNFASTYIKDDLIKGLDIKLDEGTIFEELNGSTGPVQIQAMLDDTIDNFFRALRDPSPVNMIFPVTLQASNGVDKYNFEKYVNLNDNPAFSILLRADQYLLLLLLLSLFFLLLTILFISDNTSGRLVLLGASSVSLGILILALTILINRYLPDILESLVKGSRFVEEAKLVIGIKRVVLELFESQTVRYYLEAAGAAIFGLVAIWFSKLFTREPELEILKDGTPKKPEKQAVLKK